MRLGAYRLLGEISPFFNYLKVNKNIKISGLSGVPRKFISSLWSQASLGAGSSNIVVTQNRAATWFGTSKTIGTKKVRHNQEEATV